MCRRLRHPDRARVVLVDRGGGLLEADLVEEVAQEFQRAEAGVGRKPSGFRRRVLGEGCTVRDRRTAAASDIIGRQWRRRRRSRRSGTTRRRSLRGVGTTGRRSPRGVATTWRRSHRGVVGHDKSRGVDIMPPFRATIFAHLRMNERKRTCSREDGSKSLLGKKRGPITCYYSSILLECTF